nr:AzlD domain-containing protein [Roseococcus pinisoli]
MLILACAGMRAAGLLVAGRLKPDHPFVRWAGSVAQATLTAFVLAAVIAPGGIMASLPLVARVAGLAAAVAILFWRGGLLLPVLGGLAVTLVLAAL